MRETNTFYFLSTTVDTQQGKFPHKRGNATSSYSSFPSLPFLFFEKRNSLELIKEAIEYLLQKFLLDNHVLGLLSPA